MEVHTKPSGFVKLKKYQMFTRSNEIGATKVVACQYFE
jgi:hypothetical protein